MDKQLIELVRRYEEDITLFQYQVETMKQRLKESSVMNDRHIESKIQQIDKTKKNIDICKEELLKLGVDEKALFSALYGSEDDILV